MLKKRYLARKQPQYQREKPSLLRAIIKKLISGVIVGVFIFLIIGLVKFAGSKNLSDIFPYVSPLFNKVSVDDKKAYKLVKIIDSELSKDMDTTKVISTDPTDNSVSKSSKEIKQSLSFDTTYTSENALAKIALISDIHSDYVGFKNALESAQKSGVDKVIILGDLTSLGVIEDLQEGKKILDDSGLDYVVISGDHDLWKSSGYFNFLEVFGERRYKFEVKGTKFVVLDNSANYSLIPEEDIKWSDIEVTDADFVILSQPLLQTLVNRYMGVIDGEVTDQVKKQGEYLLFDIRKSSVKAVFAGDLHTSYYMLDPMKDSLIHIIVGAITTESNFQSPRFSLLYLFENNVFRIEEVMLE